MSSAFYEQTSESLPLIAHELSEDESDRRILIVDDDPIFRRGLKDILAEHFPKATFGEAGQAQQALELVWQKSWEVVVLDIRRALLGQLDLVGSFHMVDFADRLLVRRDDVHVFLDL